jgi:hypothetical protein
MAAIAKNLANIGGHPIACGKFAICTIIAVSCLDNGLMMSLFFWIYHAP